MTNSQGFLHKDGECVYAKMLVGAWEEGYVGVSSLPDLPSAVFDCLQYVQTKEEARPGESYHVIRGTHDVTGSRYEYILQAIINWRWGRPGTEANHKLEVGKARD